MNKEKDKQRRINKHDVITGQITSIKNNTIHVNITVQFYDEKEKEKTFRLKKPQDKDEYTIDNELIKFINLFGEDSHSDSYDVTRLLYRDVSIKKIDDKYELNMPDSISYISKLKYNLKNNLISREMINWDTSFIDIIKSNKVKFIHSISLGLVSITSLIFLSYSMSLTDYLFYGFVVGLFSFMILIFITAVQIGLINTILPEQKDISGYGDEIFTSTVTLSLMLMYLLSKTSLMNISTLIDREGIHIITGLQTSISSVMLFSSILVLYSIKDGIKNKIKSKYHSIRNVFNRNKGVEYIK